MTKEYIIRVKVDEDGHEYDMTRVQELIRCTECKYKNVCCSEIMMMSMFANTSIKFCSQGKQK